MGTLRHWHLADSDVAIQLPTAQDRFAATWLTQYALSSEARDVLAAAGPAWRIYFDRLDLLRLPKFRIATWDAGWWQVRGALTEAGLAASELAVVRVCHDRVKEKLLPQVTALGFLG